MIISNDQEIFIFNLYIFLILKVNGINRLINRLGSDRQNRPADFKILYVDSRNS